VFVRFGDHDFIAYQQVDLIGTVDMLTKEHPKQHGPGEDRGEKALDSAVTAAFARSARDPQHRNPTGHHQYSESNPMQLAQGCGRYMVLEAVEQCYNTQN